MVKKNKTLETSQPAEVDVDAPKVELVPTNKVVFHVTAKELLLALNFARTCASEDYTRPHICSVYMQFLGTKVLFVATDEHTLCKMELPVTTDDVASEKQTANILMDMEKVVALISALKSSAKQPAPITVSWDVAAATFELKTFTSATTFPCTHHKYRFPSYEQAIPKCLLKRQPGDGGKRINGDPRYLARGCEAFAKLGEKAVSFLIAESELAPIGIMGAKGRYNAAMVVMPTQL